MALLPILTGAENPLLRAKTRKIPRVTKEIRALLRDMEVTMLHADGVGLAAPQIGQSLRLCIALLEGKVLPFINPDIVWKSEEEEVTEEGCLSLPGITVAVPRARSITVCSLDTRGQRQERHLTDLPARILQHEMDHLDGILIIDHQARTHA